MFNVHLRVHVCTCMSLSMCAVCGKEKHNTNEQVCSGLGNSFTGEKLGSPIDVSE